LSVEDTLEGRQMCSSTPIVFTPRTRPGTLMSVSACGLIALQQVSHATPRWRAIADMVVSSCRSASTAHATARAVSFARGAAKEWSSVHVARGQAGSRHHQIRLNHRTRTARAKQGASCSTWTRRP
jgi:hypothetical protein